jgi:hypothetical protein
MKERNKVVITGDVTEITDYSADNASISILYNTSYTDIVDHNNTIDTERLISEVHEPMLITGDRLSYYTTTSGVHGFYIHDESGKPMENTHLILFYKPDAKEWIGFKYSKFTLAENRKRKLRMLNQDLN